MLYIIFQTKIKKKCNKVFEMSRNKVVKQAAFIAPGNKKEVCKIYNLYH